MKFDRVAKLLQEEIDRYKMMVLPTEYETERNIYIAELQAAIALLKEASDEPN